ncbi:NLI interacting factor-like phosphatase family protein [Tritrichomonas foetus]|uniref:NLI interacting factor-like phosphatase family protein n=1 Tax=Tritrichomonas foetus TaxID=1144522 RepID=A0A1J4J373_9EUKA|nr:NLI interacting factor-like phosphatase family protein [Tritrichomonas foetus]|eukprot:OHS93870.1 NLI interacting factor-like phosphatase family protein [Tritrichomonas foetus]
MNFSFFFPQFLDSTTHKTKESKNTPAKPPPGMEKLTNYQGPTCMIPNIPPKVHKQALILDLDETLIHSTTDTPKNGIEYFKLDLLYVYVRPNIVKFLSRVYKMFDVFIFTASEKSYADPIIDRIFPSIDVQHRIYRDSCKFIDGNICKDLHFFQRNLRKIILIDDKINTFTFFPENTISIKPWIDDKNDNVLMKKILPVLKKCNKVDDVRSVIAEFQKNSNV